MRSGMMHVRRAIVEIGIFSFFVNALMLVMPIYMLQVYDRILPSSSIETLFFLSILAAAALLLLAVLETVRAIYANRIAARLDVAQSADAMMAAMESPRAPLGDVQTLRDLSAVRSFIDSRSAFALFDLPFAPFFIGLLWLIHPVLFWLAAAGSVILACAAVANQLASSAAVRRSSEHNIAAMMTAQSFVRNAETLRAMGMTGNAIAAWGNQHAPALTASDDVARINAFFTGLSRFLRLGLQVAMLGFGAWLVLHDEMTAGMIFAASIISGRGLQPIDQVIGGWRQFVEVRAAWVRFSRAMAERASEKPRTELPAPAGRVDVEDLVYLAPSANKEARPIIKRISFRVPAGAVVGMVGPSGAGKSTLARLLVGAIRPRSGHVRIDGADLRNWDPDHLGRHLGYLPQDVELLPGTIGQNIARFTPDHTDADIVTAAQRAHVHDLIQSMPEGYDTVIGPQGMVLSGGQRQRVGLARAFFGEPSLLVLDEPNANLDTDGDRALELALEEARRSKTTVVIVTQRRSIIEKVDALMLVRDGEIEDYGTRDEVMARQKKKALEEAARRKQAANLNKDAPPDTPDPQPPKDDAAKGEAGKSPFASFGPGMRPIPGGAKKREG
ncbi:type I secretion system permease/ATPase [Oricola sp.]|uniref:type I secretion system permease/ATPase n=1 Tax=Oricola sp. TaxID=1979950 RepID=UPI0025D1ECB2|nr:type I secretion system permease/ATPase [Oricola sp.]MCI5077135.1 type I secretion system permease/ATPase [Oricola sp.]